MRAFNIARSVLVVLLFSSMLFIAWLINTESGLNWTVARARPYLPGTLQLKNMHGSLSGPVTVETVNYQDDGLTLTIDQALLNWNPAALLVGQLRFSAISAQRIDLQLPATQGQNTTFVPPSISLPVNLAVRNVDINHIHIQPPDQQPIDIDHFGLAASIHWDALKLKHLELAAYNARLEASGKVELSGNYSHDLNFSWQADDTPLGTARGKGTLEGDLEHTRLSHELNQPVKAQADLTLSGLLQHPSWKGHIKTAAIELQQLKPDLPRINVSLDTRIQGDLHQQQLDGSLKSNSELLGKIDGDYQLALSQELIKIKTLALYTADRSRRAELHGQWQPGSDGGQMELALSWHGLGWPLQGDTQVSSANGSAWLEGKPDDYRFTLAGDLASPHWNDSQLRASGTGNLQGITFNPLHLLTLAGEISGPVKLDWAQAFAWQGTLNGHGLNPAQRWPDWPGSLDFRIDTQGDTRAGLAATLAIHNISGSLRQLPVQLTGRLAWQHETLTLDKVRFRSADSSAAADGSIGAQLALDWQIKSKQLSQLYPVLKGSLEASGSLSGERAMPLLQLKLQGQELAWQQYAIGTIKAKGKADLFQWQTVMLNAEATQLKLAGQPLERVNIDLGGKGQRQQLTVAIKQAASTLELHADGTRDKESWRGEVDKVNIHSTRFGDWQLRQKTPLTFAPGELSVQQLCLDSRDGHLCFLADYNRQTWNGKLESTHFPLAVLSPLFKKAVTLDGTADISASAALDRKQTPHGQARIQLYPGSVAIRMPDNELATWDYQHGSVDIILGPKALEAFAQLTITAQDSLQLNASLPNFNPLDFNPAKQQLQGSAKLQLSQLELLQGLVYEARNIQGQVEMNADVSGTLAAPDLNGRLTLTDGSLDIPRLGLKIRNIKIKANGNDHDFNYQLDADSGDGHLTASGTTQLQPQAGWPTKIDIKGNNLQASNIPEARIDVSPDMTVNIKHRRIDAEGTVRIPDAKLQPKDLSSAELPSDDVQIIGAPPPRTPPWQIYSNIRLILSDRIFLSGYGFDGRITGNVQLKTEPGKPPVGVGELSVVEGRYSAYGQRLDVERGRLLFASSPLNNPGLDLRAVRHVQDVTAGFSVTGTLRNPKFAVFSTPAMGQTDALSYLLLGRPLEEGATSDGSVVAGAALALGLKGGDFLARKIGDRFGLDEVRLETSPTKTGEEASLLMGRYLSPKLYISYGVGLIEAVNTLRLRYEISDRWQLTAESGQEQGADLVYTFERGD
jgi:translocation and assembly module TamB